MSFVIPVKLDSPGRESMIKRCYESIRRLYPTAPVIIVLAKDSLPLGGIYHANIVINQGYSAIGAMRAFADFGTTDHAYILHDSMVVLHQLPDIDPDIEVQPIYHFDGPPSCSHYESLYRTFFEGKYDAFCSAYTQGIMGSSVLIRRDVADRLFSRRVIDMASGHLWFEAMERIFPVHCLFHCIKVSPSLCGSIFEEDADPWKHSYRESYSVDELLHLHPYILKSACGRL